MSLKIASAAQWPTVLARLRALAPEVFDSEGHILNLAQGRWANAGKGRAIASPIDGTPLGSLPMLDHETAVRAVEASAREGVGWGKVELDERRRRVSACLDEMEQHRELLALLLVWDIGKPYRQAMTSVDRCISGVRWYVEHIERMQGNRAPLGLISNIASWNYPLSVLMHAVLVQVLAGNAVIAKTPTEGGLHSLTLAMAIAKRAGLPVSLVAGSGASLSEALVKHPAIDCVAFVGGKSTGKPLASWLREGDKRYMLEMEGVNAYGVWQFSDWKGLASQIQKGFEYAKQRCTAYPRWVVERRLMPHFLETYLGVLSKLRVGHPLAVSSDNDALPDVDFASLISKKQVAELEEKIADAVSRGAVPLYRGTLNPAAFIEAQDRAAYLPPVTLLSTPHSCALYHNEPFGPVDTLVVVDSLEELIAEMNVSNGSLVSSIACDDAELAKTIAQDLRAFKVGHNKLRSRGDREELFGGIGQSWKGCFVGGALLVRAVTAGQPGETLPGNYEDYRFEERWTRETEEALQREAEAGGWAGQPASR
ncbi:MAG: aldehyde dehydrogenase family protein [Deltaproteobacteria bacterium]|nr:aldehyde dehydrogenase family protein [Deltaproteobacteria bacterium]